jgi:antitoxin component of RelBE/YafQ-DinJ toxin-antitoxin module
VSFRLDPVVLAQVRAALVPLGVSTTTLIERLLLDFARNNKTPSDAAVTLSRLPRPDRL